MRHQAGGVANGVGDPAGFREDADKEVSQPKTEAMRVARQLAAVASTEAEYSAAPEHECEFCGKAFEWESSRHQH